GDRTRATRTLVVMEPYLIDQLDVVTDAPGDLDLPLHVDLQVERGASELAAEPLIGGPGLEDGFRFVHDTERQTVSAHSTVEARATSGIGSALCTWTTSSQATEWWRAVAPGAPGAGERAFRLIRQCNGAGNLTSVFAWSAEVVDVELGDAIRVSLADGTTHI